jgi:hypothetical protein
MSRARVRRKPGNPKKNICHREHRVHRDKKDIIPGVAPVLHFSVFSVANTFLISLRPGALARERFY